MENPDFLCKNDEGFSLLKKVYKGRQTELDKCRILFQKVFSVQEHEVSFNAV
jgi:hypothetical protein